jgi:hypothetical protein
VNGILRAGGPAILAATALFHATGYRGLVGALSSAPGGFYSSAVPALWLISAVHWLAFAGLAWFCRPPVRGAIGALALADALLIGAYLGGFPGAWLLAAAGLLIIASAWKDRRA